MSEAPKRQAEISVTVIVPSFNSATNIVSCLRSLEAQKTSFSTEVVVVDSSTDGTADLVRSLFPNVKLIHFSERHSCGEARNAGLNATVSEIVLFIDSDCIAPENWIQVMAEQLASGGADAVCGSIGNGTPDSVSGTIGYYLEFFRFLPHPGAAAPTRWLIGGSSGFRRSVFQDFQYPDTSLGDDFLMSYRLRKQGSKLVMIPSVAILHLNRVGFKVVLDYQKRIGFAAAQYRTVTTQPLMSWLDRFPFLVLFAPLVIVPWVGSHVLAKLGFREFSGYLFQLPVCLVMSSAWAAGFFKGLRHRPVKSPR